MKPNRIVVWNGKGGWRWHAKASNGRILSDSGEGYARRGTALKYMESVTDARRRNIPVYAQGRNAETSTRLY